MTGTIQAPIATWRFTVLICQPNSSNREAPSAVPRRSPTASTGPANTHQCRPTLRAHHQVAPASTSTDAATSNQPAPDHPASGGRIPT
jgi:hypothetical protein